MITPRIMKLHRYIDHDLQMTPIDFEVTRSKVKVTSLACFDQLYICVQNIYTCYAKFDWLTNPGLEIAKILSSFV
ncbi:hypothetical protein DPMN_010728 [Dreissena polymorpha]|uniref:Uncharacterized protein n=1 Tax=Dreissena polymorpha TaxID=45954 RepID=A0A9D4N0F5_DREPO|nr:hypothetical protein DPMN_010728 [Dreissena polymorpha]